MLAEKLSDYNIILASNSPRRQQFFKDLNLEFTIDAKNVEEIYDESLQGSEITNYLAKLKASPFINLSENDLLITSDTIVWLNNKALGKPKNYDEAFEMLANLSGTSHTVITSVFIKNQKFQKLIHDTTEVTFKTLQPEEIEYYIKKYKPYDKAGSYGIQDWIGKIGITQIKGCYFNVMGLPVQKLYKELMNL